VIVFVGKEAYRGAFNERAELGLQERSIADTSLFVLPSTSPANAAVPYAERLRWFRELRTWLAEGVELRPAVRALVVGGERTLLFRFENPYTGDSFWTTPGGGLEPGEAEGDALLRELHEEVGLREPRIGPCVWRRESEYPWGKRRIRQPERYFLVDAPADELTFDAQFLAAEAVHGHHWWTVEELETTDEVVYPMRLALLLRDLLTTGPPSEPIDVGL
jgi:ADP-ribose pyrophosphatase YjhB (NUDIX family)